MKNRTYDALKWVAQYFLPALATLYFTLSEFWGLPHTEEIVGTIVAFDTFLGVVLGLSTRRYNKSDSKYAGAFVVNQTDPMQETIRLEIEDDLEGMAQRNEILFKVKQV